MTWENFNDAVLKSMSSSGPTFPNYMTVPAFGQLSSGTQDFVLPGLLSQNQFTNELQAGSFTVDNSSFIPNLTLDTTMLMPNMSDALDGTIDSMLSNFTQELDAKYAQLEKMIESLNLGAPGAAPYSDEDTSYFSYDAKALKDKWSKKKPNLSDAFYNKVVEVAKRVQCDPNDLMALMNAESGLNPAAVNPNGGATGLIQFMPKTAQGLGTTTEKIKQMSAEEQLVYVEKYLKQAKANAGFGDNDKIGAGTLYSLVFLPAYANKNVLASRGDIYYNENDSLDINGDGQITKDELGQRVQDFMA